ncbi:hypothetical protein ROHU_015465 [Labeo rohita]|uniref:Uncharacterized protein n=1 Tax=Labeo rohita TaxID=84645 RepID=A0A498NP77_LABRO|nr:hypothetical protein ROHU_015465 [Labeo rohita]
MDVVARKSASVPSLPVKTLTRYPKYVVSWHNLGAWDRQDSEEGESKGRQIDLRKAGDMSLHHSRNSFASASWADYWTSWDLWDEVVHWDEERPAPTRRFRELRSPIRSPDRRRSGRTY